MISKKEALETIFPPLNIKLLFILLIYSSTPPSSYFVRETSVDFGEMVTVSQLQPCTSQKYTW